MDEVSLRESSGFGISLSGLAGSAPSDIWLPAGGPHNFRSESCFGGWFGLLPRTDLVDGKPFNLSSVLRSL